MLDGAWRWRHADRCTQPKLFRFAQSNVCRICTALWHANGSTTRKQQKRVAECKRQHAYLSPCASATLYLEEHHLHAQSRLRRPLGRTTANGRAGALPCVWRVEPSVLPIGVDLAHPYGSALNFAGDTIPLITWLHGYTAARPCSFGRGTGSCLPASVRTWPCDAPAPIDSQGTDKEVTTTTSRRSSASDGFRFSHMWHHLEPLSRAG